MPILKNGKKISTVFRNNKSISKIYRGASLVWGAIKETLAQISGKSMTLVNCTREESLNDFKIYGKSEQIKYQGTNLFDSKQLRNGVPSLFTINDDGSVTIKGTTASRFVNMQSYWIRRDFGTYTIVNDSLDSEVWVGVYLSKDGTDATMLQRYKYGSGFETVTNSLAEYPYIRFVIGCRETKEYNITIHPQFNIGTSPKPYEPYVGGIPSPSPSYPQEIHSVSTPTVDLKTANIWNEEWVLGDLNSSGALVSGNYLCGADFIEVKPRTSYVIKAFKDIAPSSIPYYYVEYDENYQKVVGYIKASNGTSFLTRENTKYIRFQFGGGYGSPATYTNDIMVVEGRTEPTEYQPYEVKSYTWNHTLYGIPVSYNWDYVIDNQGWVGDYVDVENKRIVRRVMHTTFTIPTIISLSPNGDHYYVFLGYGQTGIPPFATYSDMKTGDVVCRNIYPQNGANGNENIYRSWNAIILSVADGMSLAEVKARFEGLEVEIIANVPTTYEPLTDAEIEAFKQLKTFKPTTIVTNNYDAHMSTSYHTKLEELDAQLINLYNSDIKEITQ